MAPLKARCPTPPAPEVCSIMPSRSLVAAFCPATSWRFVFSSAMNEV